MIALDDVPRGVLLVIDAAAVKADGPPAGCVRRKI